MSVQTQFKKGVRPKNWAPMNKERAVTAQKTRDTNRFRAEVAKAMAEASAEAIREGTQRIQWLAVNRIEKAFMVLDELLESDDEGIRARAAGILVGLGHASAAKRVENKLDGRLEHSGEPYTGPMRREQMVELARKILAAEEAKQ